MSLDLIISTSRSTVPSKDETGQEEELVVPPVLVEAVIATGPFADK